MLIALTREVSPAIANCELEFLDRQPIDVALAEEQHREYQACLAELGAHVEILPAEPDLPDSMFVEDPAVVLDDVAVITRMSAASRRGEADSLARALAAYRELLRREPHSGDADRWRRRLTVAENADVSERSAKAAKRPGKAAQAKPAAEADSAAAQ